MRIVGERKRKELIHLTAFGLVLFMAWLIMAGPAAAAGLRVVQDPADLRSGPGLLYGVPGELEPGTVLTQIAAEDGWYQVTAPGGVSGWVYGADVTAFSGPGTPAKMGWPQAAVYAGPGTGYPVAGWIRQGESLTVWGQSGAWAQVSSDTAGVSGWLPAALLTSAPGAAPDLPPALSVVTQTLNVRAGPQADTRLLTVVGRDDLLLVRDRLGGWYEVLTPDGILGWVDGQYTVAAPLPVQGGLVADVAQRAIDLFAGPGTGFPVVAWAGHGSSLTVVGRKGDWLQVKLPDGRKGWMPAALLHQDQGGAFPTPGHTGLSVISGKGVWYEGVDQVADASDFDNPLFKEAGISHVYLQAGDSRFGFPSAWRKELDILIPAAHADHIKVILWVYVQLHNIAADAALTARVANYVTPDGQKPDAVAADIEELPGNAEAARQLTAGYASLVRPLLPKGMPFLAVTYPPQFMGYYPFAVMADDFDGIVLMDYWHNSVNNYGEQGAAALVTNSLILLRARAGRAVPVEVILQGFDGGTGWPDRREMEGALSAARAADGYSVYTWRSMNGPLREAFARFR